METSSEATPAKSSYHDFICRMLENAINDALDNPDECRRREAVQQQAEGGGAVKH